MVLRPGNNLNYTRSVWCNSHLAWSWGHSLDWCHNTLMDYALNQNDPNCVIRIKSCIVPNGLIIKCCITCPKMYGCSSVGEVTLKGISKSDLHQSATLQRHGVSNDRIRDCLFKGVLMLTTITPQVPCWWSFVRRKYLPPPHRRAVVREAFQCNYDYQYGGYVKM